MPNLLSTVTELFSEPTISILLVGGIIIVAASAIWSAVERYFERLAQGRDF